MKPKVSLRRKSPKRLTISTYQLVFAIAICGLFTDNVSAQTDVQNQIVIPALQKLFEGNLNTTKIGKSELRTTLSADYTRAGFTLVFLSDQNSRYKQELESAFKAFQVPPRFDNNQLKEPIIAKSSTNRLDNANALNVLYGNKIPNEIVSYIFNEKEGKYNYDRLFDRARYGLDDNAVMRLKQSAQGVEGNAKTDTWILPLIAQTYVIVLDVGSIMNWDEYYDNIDRQEREAAQRQKRQFIPVKRQRRGFDIDAKASLLKINLKDSSLNSFFENYWVDNYTKADLAKQNLANRSLMKLPVDQLITFSTDNLISGFRMGLREASSPSAGLNFALKHALESAVENLGDLKVKQAVYDIDPIRAKLGTKDGLTPDKTFGVYENIQLADGSAVAEYRGSVRTSVGVVDNASNASGSTKPSEFYQISGKKLDIGMIMQEEPNRMIAVMVGGSFNPSGNDRTTDANGSFVIRLEALTKGFGSTNKFWNNARVYLEFEATGKSFATPFDKLYPKDSGNAPVSKLTDKPTSASIYSIAFGASKYFNFWRIVQTGPYAGLRGSLIQFSNTEMNDAAKADFGNFYGFKGITVDLGWRLGVAITKRTRIVCSYGIAPYFTNAKFFGTNKLLTEGSSSSKRLLLDPGPQTTAYTDPTTANPFYITYNWVRFDLGMHFEF